MYTEEEVRMGRGTVLVATSLYIFLIYASV